jgi:hypothetical protein
MRPGVLIALAATISGCSPASDKQVVAQIESEAPVDAVVQPPVPAETDPVIQKALVALKGESKIKDIMYRQNETVRWTVGVFDDGTNRNGYAEYVCLTLKHQGVDLKGSIVRVVDIAKIAQGGVPGSGTSLGSMNCESWQPFD